MVVIAPRGTRPFHSQLTGLASTSAARFIFATKSFLSVLVGVVATTPL
jgi:hypothetical protein